jgi:hypothetical protein
MGVTAFIRVNRVDQTVTFVSERGMPMLLTNIMTVNDVSEFAMRAKTCESSDALADVARKYVYRHMAVAPWETDE